MGQQPISELFLNNIDVLPLWVKQVLYLKTRDKLREELAEFSDVLLTDNLMQYYIPKLTFAGKTELETREKRLPDEFYTFYQNCSNGNDLFEITLANYWTFSQTCSIFVRSIELQLITIPEDETIISIAQFMAGKIRTGEMLKGSVKLMFCNWKKQSEFKKTETNPANPSKWRN